MIFYIKKTKYYIYYYIVIQLKLIIYNKLVDFYKIIFKVIHTLIYDFMIFMIL